MENIFKKLRYWVKYNFNKNKFELTKEAIIGNPYDYSYFYTIQLKKLEEMYAYFSVSKFIDDEKKTNILRWIDLAIKTLRLGYLNGEGVFDITELSTNPNPTPDNAMSKWIITCTRYVNLKNKHRYEHKFSLLPEDYDLYQEKARCLYHKIIKEKSMDWWD